jgi:COG1974: SOS-response transcriptional repressors (recA-mediated autopeptidases)|nr:MAG TPA: LexA-like protein [Caudoviricetes sp.]
MATLGERIKAYREQLKISQKELAERCNNIDTKSENARWGQPRIANYEKGNRTPDLEDISIISKALNILPEVLAFDSNISEIKESICRYPLLSPIQAGLWTDIRSLEGFDGYEMIPSTVIASENSFYLRIEGKSMLPRFNEGDLVLIDPDIAPTPGKFVAAINGNNEATFKQYKELGTRNEYGIAHFELVPLNPMFPTLSSLNQEIRIIGVAVEKREML